MRRLLTIAGMSVLLWTSLHANIAFRIRADIPADSAYADSVIRLTATRLTDLIGPFSVESLDVYIVTSEARFDSLAGGSIPDWGAAVAEPLRRLIVIKSPLILHGDKALGELVAHEFSHIALAEATRYRPVPRWLDEGMAMYLSAEWGWDDDLAMGWAIVLGNNLPLSEIDNLNRFVGGRVQVAYSESYLAFRYLIDTYGRSGVSMLLDSLRAGYSSDRALEAATGADYAAFNQEFTTYLTGRYNLVSLIFNSNALWIILAALVVVGFILYRLRRKTRFKQFDEYDKLHSTDFDYGEVEKPDEDKPWD
jgi:Peptidase MA superfamily